MPRREYADKLAADNASAKAKSKNDRDIAGDYPPPGNLDRRAACENNLKLFLSTYFANAFTLAWSNDHNRILACMQTIACEGGLLALAMPRGSGKTTIVERLALWALLYGHRRFVCLVGATEPKAADLLAHIKTELMCNPLLLADFRHVCYPITRIENNARRCVGQLFDGQQTRLTWAADKIILPIMPDSACDGVNVSGGIISVCGLTGALRGQSHTLPDGTIIRPDLVIPDDPQTRESAMSTSQSAERLAILNGDLLGMAGPVTKISACCPCTVIRAGDMSDMLLDRQRSPRWQGQKCKMMYAFPTHERLWEQYGQMRAESFRKGGKGEEATEFYGKNRAVMDEGAIPAWPARYHADELSAIQCAMNLRCDDEGAFQAEYMNEPIRLEQGESTTLTPAQIAGKCNGLPRGMVPAAAERLTAFVDVHDSLLFYAVVAWSAGFDGFVLDYGAWPAQGRRYFTLRKATPTLALAYPGLGREGAIRAGLSALLDTLCGKAWPRERGGMLRIERLLVDAGFLPDLVHSVCGGSKHAGVLLPSRGMGIGAAGRPISDYSRTKGDRIAPAGGGEWYIPKRDKRTGPHLRFDSNFYKSLVMTRLAVAVGDKGCLSFYGSSPEEHRLMADQCCSESPIRTTGRGRTLDEWKVRPDATDNHLWDCLVGCAAAASLQGVGTPGAVAKPKPRPRLALPLGIVRPQRKRNAVRYFF